MKYDHDLAIEKIRQEQANKLIQNVPTNATMPELPVFEDDKDSIDDYLQCLGAKLRRRGMLSF